jgi:peptidoglycan/xylan/chitin deacetylase (PgdA/CDA1 family)
LLAAPGAEDPVIPPKTVVLTFDDAVKSQLEIVAPMLKEYGFGATFFISHGWMNDREHFMSWEEVAQLHRMGFEIGNHTWTHAGFNTPQTAARLAGELALVENELSKVGVPKPISFAWPGNNFGPDALAVLERAGYRVARRGMQPEAAYGSLELGPLFEPRRYHRLLVPSAGDAYPNWNLEHFKKVVDRVVPGQAAVLQFHGVPDLAHPWVNTPVENFRSYLAYLKEGEFRVIALRDLLPYLPTQPAQDDAMAHTQYPAKPASGLYWPTETEQTRAKLDFWLMNMVRDHGYSLEEAMQVSRLPKKLLQDRLVRLGGGSAFLGTNGSVKVLSYPGGRHPRIGFLEGAIDPLRGTKVSIFPPWNNGGYMVLDLPEAIFSNLGLAFLAHTHVPTIWNARNTLIENEDWTVHSDGSLQSEWHLPNGIAFGARVSPAAKGVNLQLWLDNGTKEKLTGLRTQICLMLKAAPGFNAQDQQGKIYAKPLVVDKALDANRYLLLAFERCGRAWGNQNCPCVHSDPVLPDAEPGQRVSVQGRLSFYEGPDIEDERRRFLKELPWP